eukprot:258679-Amphidinium_carterae.1
MLYSVEVAAVVWDVTIPIQPWAVEPTGICIKSAPSGCSVLWCKFVSRRHRNHELERLREMDKDYDEALENEAFQAQREAWNSLP